MRDLRGGRAGMTDPYGGLGRVRLAKWGATHLLTRESESKPSKQTVCGRRFFQEDALEPRPRKGTCVQCRDTFLGKERVHIRRKRRQPQKLTKAEKALRRRRRRAAETGVSDIQRSIERNPESGKMGGLKKWGRRMFDAVRTAFGRWTSAFRGKR